MDKNLEIIYKNLESIVNEARKGVSQHLKTIKQYETSSSQNPQDTSIINQQIQWLSESLHDFHNYMIHLFSKSLEINPKQDAIWFKTGQYLEKQLRGALATECYDKSIEFHPHPSQDYVKASCDNGIIDISQIIFNSGINSTKDDDFMILGAVAFYHIKNSLEYFNKVSPKFKTANAYLKTIKALDKLSEFEKAYKIFELLEQTPLYLNDKLSGQIKRWLLEKLDKEDEADKLDLPAIKTRTVTIDHYADWATYHGEQIDLFEYRSKEERVVNPLKEIYCTMKFKNCVRDIQQQSRPDFEEKEKFTEIPKRIKAIPTNDLIEQIRTIGKETTEIYLKESRKRAREIASASVCLNKAFNFNADYCRNVLTDLWQLGLERYHRARIPRPTLWAYVTPEEVKTVMKRYAK